jgi:hypothetical protein
MNRLKFLRVVYLSPLLLIGLYPVSIPCQQCSNEAYSESIYARIASKWEDNFFCSFTCATDWLEENPREFDETGKVIPKTSIFIKED